MAEIGIFSKPSGHVKVVELAKLLKKEIKVPINLGKLESVVSVECCPSLLFF